MTLTYFCFQLDTVCSWEKSIPQFSSGHAIFLVVFPCRIEDIFTVWIGVVYGTAYKASYSMDWKTNAIQNMINCFQFLFLFLGKIHVYFNLNLHVQLRFWKEWLAQ